MIVTPGPVVDFLLANQNARDPDSLDWNKVINDYQFCLHSEFECVASIIKLLLFDSMNRLNEHLRI